MKKTILLTILFLALLVLIISSLPPSKEKAADTPDNIPNNEVKETENPPIAISPSGVIVTKAKDAESVPEGFPTIPLNGREKILASYTLSYNDTKGAEQKVVDFLSSDSVGRNVSFYEKWAEENNWNIIHQSNIDGESRIILEKDAKSLTISIKEAEEAGKSAVNISY